MKLTPKLLCPLLYSLLCLAACGAKPSPQAKSSTAKIPPCSLLSQAEVSAILETAIADAVQERNSCSYKPAQNALKGVTVEVQAGHADAAMLGARANAAGLGVNLDTVQSVGDDAFYGELDVLYVRKGDVFLSFDVRVSQNPRQKAKQLALKAVSHLP